MRLRGIAYLLVSIAALALLSGVRDAFAQDRLENAAWQRYLHILQTSNLEWRDSESFLLKIDFQLYDLTGNYLLKGTAEESWTEAGQKHIRIQSPALVVDSASDADDHRNHTRESYLVYQALGALARPFPLVVEYKDFAMDQFHQVIGGVERSCFSIVPPGQTRSSEALSYCTDMNNRVTAMTGPFYVIDRSTFKRFLGHDIPMDLKISYEGKIALEAHVTELDELPGDPPSDAGTLTAKSNPSSPAELFKGHYLTKETPSYPKSAKRKHITGSVLITAIITKQGTLVGLDVIASPDPLLSASAMDAVKTWTYEPYLLNGTPTEVDTTITVNYNMGSK